MSAIPKYAAHVLYGDAPYTLENNKVLLDDYLTPEGLRSEVHLNKLLQALTKTTNRTKKRRIKQHIKKLSVAVKKQKLMLVLLGGN